jgi:predicted AlkP superfamily pyrophosphatase or phosphodiesterase
MLSTCLLLSACGDRSNGKKVLLIGLDGVRVDILAAASTPNIDALIANGTFSDNAQTRPRTVSGPGWSSMLTGVWSDKHGVRSNDLSSNAFGTYPDFLTRLEQTDSSFNTFAVVDWAPLGKATSGGPLIGDGIDVKIVFDGDSDAGYPRADSQSVAAASAYLTFQNPDAAFVYLGNIDVVGHSTNSLSAEYLAAIETADAQVGELVAALKRRPSYAAEDWLILMSTDHGRRDDGGHGEPSLQERTIFYLASGPSATRGVPQTAPEIVDVGVTALAHLGVIIDPAWGLDGRVVGLPLRQ